MQTIANVTVDPQALTGWTALPTREQTYILETLGELAAQPPDQWSNPSVKHLPTNEPLFFMRAHNGLLVIFRRTEKAGITILDLVLQETIERYFMPKTRTPGDR